MNKMYKQSICDRRLKNIFLETYRCGNRDIALLLLNEMWRGQGKIKYEEKREVRNEEDRYE